MKKNNLLFGKSILNCMASNFIMIMLLLVSTCLFAQKPENEFSRMEIVPASSTTPSYDKGFIFIPTTEFTSDMKIIPAIRAFDENNGNFAFIANGDNTLFLYLSSKEISKIELTDIPEEVSISDNYIIVLIGNTIQRYNFHNQLVESFDIKFNGNISAEAIKYDKKNNTYLLYNNDIEQTTLLVSSAGFVKKEKGWKLSQNLSARKMNSNVYQLNIGNFSKSYESSDEIALVRFIGESKNTFKLLVETIDKDNPSNIKRRIDFIGNKKGNIMNSYVLNSISDLKKRNYSFTSDYIFEQDSTGIYLVYPENINRLKTGNFYRIYPYEPKTELQNSVPKATISRSQIIANIDPYINLSYTVKPVNCSPSSGVYVGNKLVKTAFQTTSNITRTGTAYMWGGFSSVSSFSSGLSSNKYCGDINCVGTNADNTKVFGIDCSGLAQKGFGFTSHVYSTSTITDIISKYQNNNYNAFLFTDWTRLNKGDVIRKVGHIIICRNYNSDGSLSVSESSLTDNKCSTRNYSISQLSAYEPWYYNNTQMAVLRIKSIGVLGFPIIPKNSLKTFSVTITNTGSATFCGDIIFQLFTSTGNFVGNIGSVIGTSIAAGSNKSFSVSKYITSNVGNYLVCIKAKEVNGTYYSILKSSNGTVTNWYHITISALKSVVESTNLSDEQFNLYPNPSNGQCFIKVPIDYQGIVEILDITGKIIDRIMIYDSNKIEYNLRTGMYLIKFKDYKYNVVRKFVVQ